MGPEAIEDLSSAATLLRSLHRRGEPLLLVNAWDVASARAIVAAGAQVVATTSNAIAASLGLPDDATADVDATFAAIGRIAAAVDVPVTADVLDGYGLAAEELVARLVAAGAVGCNIEDSDHAHPGTLLDPDVVAERLAAVRAAAASAGVDLVVNARIDTFVHGRPDGVPDVVARGRRYLAAGADCVYPIQLTDPAVAREIVDQLDAAVNANLRGAGPAARTAVAELAAAGVSRISVGPQAYRAALATVERFATDILGAGSPEGPPA
jgi:2-methylisocitrate lyase-like PEP mutase family enzyme